MYHLWSIGQRFFCSPRVVRNVMLTGGSIASFGLLKQPTQELITNMNAFTPTKVNIALMIGFALLASNAFFAYRYFQLLNQKKDDEVPTLEESKPNP